MCVLLEMGRLVLNMIPQAKLIKIYRFGCKLLDNFNGF